MVDRCKICRETKEPALSSEEEKLADMLYDNSNVLLYLYSNNLRHNIFLYSASFLLYTI